LERGATSCREALRAATQAPHARLHLHSGFSSVQDGTICLADYRALLVRLYGFYQPFERAVGLAPIRTRWLESDLVWLGLNPGAFPRIRQCADLPPLTSPDHRLGALYVVEGSALGGRQLARGLDPLLGKVSPDGRHFFSGRGSATGTAWRDYLRQLETVDAHPERQAVVLTTAIQIFDAFETWLETWSAIA
jgi:heme oxygenase